MSIKNENIIRASGALKEGHFLLSSGRHSGQYMEKALFLQYPLNVESLCRNLARRFARDRPEVVIGPTTLGVVLAYETAKQLGPHVRSVFAERDDEGRRVLRRGLKINPGERVLIVDDVLTTGRSIREVLDVVREAKGVPIGVGVLVNRSESPTEFDVPVESLIQMDAVSYAPEDCPLCQEDLPLIKPGSRKR